MKNKGTSRWNFVLQERSYRTLGPVSRPTCLGYKISPRHVDRHRTCDGRRLTDSLVQFITLSVQHVYSRMREKQRVARVHLPQLILVFLGVTCDLRIKIQGYKCTRVASLITAAYRG